jgi:hypothetical protein
MRLLVILILVIGAAGPLRAGAWLQDKGSYFASADSNIWLAPQTDSPVHYDPALYLEYGWRADATLGLNYFSADQGLTDHLVASLMMPIRAGAPQMTGSLALAFQDGADAALQIGLAVGHSWDRGWASADASASATHQKLDLTWGQHLHPDWAVMAQVQTGQVNADAPYAKLQVSAIYQISPTQRISAGLIHALTGDGGTGLRVAVWLTSPEP